MPNWIETRLPSGRKVMVQERTLNRHELRCLKKYGWEVVCHSPLELRHGDGESLATGQAAEAVIGSVTAGEPDYEEMIRYDGRNCNCEAGDEAESQGGIHDSGAVHDARGIYLCRACPECIEEKLSRYCPEILTGYNQADVDEQIEEE